MYLRSCEITHNDPHNCARALLAALYAEQTGSAMPQILTERRGKPCFAHGDWHFSISHTKRHAFCVLSKTPVGIDAEELDRQVKPQLAQKILSPRELAQYEMAQDKKLALLKFWVLKEAAAKLTGEGLHGYPNNTDFSLDDARLSIIDGCVVAVMEGKA